MTRLTEIICSFNETFSDKIMIIFLLGTGLIFTLRDRFPQIRYLGEGLKNTFSGLFTKEKKDGISPFSALMTSLAAQLGTGNIVGAGSAVLLGGPGAVMWMWISAFFGMATAYREAVFAQRTRIIRNGRISGGAVFYISEAYRGKTGEIIASVFAFFSMTALGFTGVAVQSNSIAVSLNEAFNIPTVFSGIALLAGALIILSKGEKAVARLSGKTVPLMTFLYILFSLLVIIKNISFIPQAFRLIIFGAFSPSAVGGALTGISLKTVISQGVKRGLFTNEAGMGSTPCAHALADAPSPHFQGTLGIAGVFIDTFVMLSLTALSIICTVYKNGYIPTENTSGSLLVSLAFSEILGKRGAKIFIALSILFFAFASIIGWSLFGKTSAVFLFGESSERLYLISSVLFVFIGAVITDTLSWALTDMFNCFMVMINAGTLLKSDKKKQGPKLLRTFGQ